MHRTGADRHLAFGKGLTTALGANLGKLEAQIAIAELARRYPSLALAPGQHLTFHPYFLPRPPGPPRPDRGLMVPYAPINRGAQFSRVVPGEGWRLPVTGETVVPAEVEVRN